MGADKAFPVVDVFAGPGGLGEGFASLNDETGSPVFKSAASIEEDGFSHQTLYLRHFLRSFSNGAFPEDYYRYLRGSISLEELYDLYPKNKAHADLSALKISLGPGNHEAVRQDNRRPP